MSLFVFLGSSCMSLSSCGCMRECRFNIVHGGLLSSLECGFGALDVPLSALVPQVLESAKSYDVDKFTDVVFTFDSVSKLDPWRTTCARARGRSCSRLTCCWYVCACVCACVQVAAAREAGDPGGGE